LTCSQNSVKNKCAFRANRRVFQGDYYVDSHQDTCHYLAMGKTKEQVIEAIGGFRLGESQTGSSPRIRRIETLNKKLRPGIPLDQVDGIVDEMRRLQGIPSVEWDYEPHD
jgi:hypothetical protein